MLFRIYRIVHATSDAYSLGVFWLYLGLFLVTFALIFVFPPVALVMVFIGLAGLIFAVLGAKTLVWLDLGLARALLSRGICPACSMRQLPVRDEPVDVALQPQLDQFGDDEGVEWHCEGCGCRYLATGRGQPAAA